jgi:hypothetical protein
MKFSEISKEQWEELSPYLDTCLLPITGMVEPMQPYEATEWLERLRDLLDLIEIPFKGRVVTYPAWHYMYDQENFAAHVEQWCASVKQAGFRYVIVVTPDKELSLQCPSVDLWLQPTVEDEVPLQTDVSNQIRSLWSGQAT